MSKSHVVPREVHDREIKERDELLELAWGVIANASNGNWDNESEGWLEAAVSWRDAWLHLVKNPESHEKAKLDQDARFSGAVNGFASWLTTREQVVCVGISQNCAGVAELVSEYLQDHGVSPVNPIWPERIVADAVAEVTPPNPNPRKVYHDGDGIIREVK